MLLSRVAECVYWAGRYLERADAAARLVKVHTELYCDLPLAAGVGWSPLLAVTGSAAAFDERNLSAAEDEVVRFLTIDPDNPGSVVSSLHSARHNLRATRDKFPAAAWEELNELYLWVGERADEAVNRRTRSAWTTEVMRRGHLLTGLLADTMSHDDVFAFLEIGRFLERADMTTRVLDVQAAILFASENDAVEPYADVTWMSVLRTLSAHQMFRRAMHAGLSGPAALHFLLSDAQFPRSVEHCMTRVSRALIELPMYDAPMAGCAQVEQLLKEADPASLGPLALHVVVDDLQRGIADLHALVTDTYFLVPSGLAEENEAALA